MIYKGAEADLYVEGGDLVKRRVKKRYRITEIDDSLRKYRTRHEAKLMGKIRDFGFPAPKVVKVSEKDATIIMEYVDGKTLKEVFEEEPEDAVKKLSRKVGESLRLLHGNNIVHNDLTTSNMLAKDGLVYVIDWGLGYHSTRLEDKAMDLVVLKKSLRATHPSRFELIWKNVLAGYKPDKELSTRVETIENRVRYH
ncbi:MAG: KEOPS complex kinase/ATPase Bud32 [Candidatus Altiarchaeota archaeon]